MNPPISNGVQGGYLVAVVVTGAIFGGLALVFRELTEGLCCLLGGFCISMWLMTLKSGGLFTGKGARAGFIIAFAAGFYCLSFSHYTREYGTMLCAAFGGATALVLGIDCFSRAGLKEFWLYIWGKCFEISTFGRIGMLIYYPGLNDDMFPYNTSTYPVTRNIRVEIAVIIVITAFGVIGQMRLWKVIKARRTEEEDSRQETERKKDEDDIEVGRQLEADNLRELAKWERAYGNGQDDKEPSLSETAIADDSRRGSDGFGSATHEKDTSMEMKDIAIIEESADAFDSGKRLETVEEVVHDPHAEHEEVSSHREVENREEPRLGSAISQKKAAQSHFDEDNDSEHGAVLGSEAGSLRGSRKSWMNGLSWRSSNVQLPDPQSVFQNPLIVHDDATSSVAGVIDDLTLASGPPSIAPGIYDDEEDQVNERNITNEGTTKQNVLSEAALGKLNSQGRQSGAPTAATTKADLPTPHELEGRKDDTTFNEENVPENQGSKTAAATAPTGDPVGILGQKSKDVGEQLQHDQQATQLEDKKQEVSVTVLEKAESSIEDSMSEKPPSASPEVGQKDIDDARDPHPNVGNNVTVADSASQTKLAGTLKRSTLDMTNVRQIPEQTSKVIHSFRTKEWAKHLADAETPALEPLELEREEDSDVADQAAAPVYVDSLLQTALNAQPPPVVISPELSVSSSEQTQRRSDYSPLPSPEMSRSKARNSFHNLSSRSPPPWASNASTGLIVPNQEEQDVITPMLRSTSTPYLTITAPGNGKEEKGSPRWSDPPPLLAVRESIMRNRMSSTSLRHDPWASRNASRQSLAEPIQTTSPTMAVPDERDEDFEAPAPNDDDDVPLSKRRIMLQRQSMQSATETSAMNLPSATSPQSYEQSRSPQFIPTDTERSESRMAAWRQSVREDISQHRNPLAFQGSSPGAASPERSRSPWGSMQQMRETSSFHVDKAVADRMQRGSMADLLHRQAMRRMQASANRQLYPSF